MRKLNKQAEKVFRKLITGITKVGDHRTIDTSDGTFMPVIVEAVDYHHRGLVVSVSHTYVQQGDVMYDPEVCFLVVDSGIYAMSYRQDALGINQVAMIIKHDGVRLNEKLQADITSFCNGWMLSIRQQQDL